MKEIKEIFWKAESLAVAFEIWFLVFAAMIFYNSPYSAAFQVFYEDFRLYLTPEAVGWGCFIGAALSSLCFLPQLSNVTKRDIYIGAASPMGFVFAVSGYYAYRTHTAGITALLAISFFAALALIALFAYRDRRSA